MRAFTIDHYGKDGLRAAEVPEPVLGADDLLIDVRATSVNPLDSMLRDGAFKAFLKLDLPAVLGHDVAGIVTAVGSRVTAFGVGDAVIARPRQERIGTFAERIAVHQDDAAHAPTTVPLSEAASLPLVALTAWQVLVERANVQPGQKVLIHAGSGGVGTVAIQLAKHLGAHVATTTSSANADLVRSLGADEVIDYRSEDFAERLSGYDLVLSPKDGETLEKSLGVLAPGGRAVGLTGPPDPAFARSMGLSAPLRLVMALLSRRIRSRAARLGVQYSFLFMRANGEQLREIVRLVDAGIIRPVIDRSFPFEQTPEAIAYVERGRSRGKVIIEHG